MNFKTHLNASLIRLFISSKFLESFSLMLSAPPLIMYNQFKLA